MRRFSLVSVLLIIFAMIVSCGNPGVITDNVVSDIDPELAAKEAAFAEAGSRATSDYAINYISRDNKVYRSTDDGNTWSVLVSNADVATGGYKGKGEYYIDTAGNEIYHNGYISWGDYKDVSFNAYRDKAYAIDHQGKVYEFKKTDWHQNFYLMDNQPPGVVTAIDTDGLGYPWVVVDRKKVYQYKYSSWRLEYEIGSISAIKSLGDIGVGDTDTYVVGNVQPIGAQFTIPTLMLLNRSNDSMELLKSYVTKVDVTSNSSNRDECWAVETVWRGFEMYDLYKREADGSWTLKAENVAKDVGCTIYW